MAMNLKNMKKSRDEIKSDSEDPIRANYPYGLELYLHDEVMKALGITKPLPVGTTVTIEAKAIVTSTRESVEDSLNDQDGDKVDKSMSVQITDLGIEQTGEESDPAEVLYSTS